MQRLLENCPLVIFIAYTVPPAAVEGGYADWLVRVDNPFFNAIPGTRHYANWRVDAVGAGGPLVWDWFDFQGLEAESDLERVWFNPDLDAFRAEWLRLWGYGKAEPPPVLRNAYLMRPVRPAVPGRAGPRLRLRAGQGPVPEGIAGDMLFRVDGVLRKHFATPDRRPDDWLRPADAGNPLGLDWLAVDYGGESPAPPGTVVDLGASLVAAPDP